MSQNLKFTGHRNNVIVDNEDFVRINVQASLEDHDTKWIADQLGMKPESVTAKRTDLRKKGVVLPELTRGRVAAEIDVNGLNDLVKSLVNPPQAPARGSRGRRPAGALAG